MSTENEITSILDGYEGISLDEVNKASLMRRKDKKYLFGVKHLTVLLIPVISIPTRSRCITSITGAWPTGTK